MEGTLDFSQAPKYLADFDPQKIPAIVDTLLNLMSENGYVVEVHGRFADP